MEKPIIKEKKSYLLIYIIIALALIALSEFIIIRVEAYRRKFKRANGILTYHYIAETQYVGGKPRRKTLKYLGNVENILEKFKF